jgi:hypothetical protein
MSKYQCSKEEKEAIRNLIIEDRKKRDIAGIRRAITIILAFLALPFSFFVWASNYPNISGWYVLIAVVLLECCLAKIGKKVSANLAQAQRKLERSSLLMASTYVDLCYFTDLPSGKRGIKMNFKYSSDADAAIKTFPYYFPKVFRDVSRTGFLERDVLLTFGNPWCQVI